MKAAATRETFIEMLTTASRGSATKSTLPILGNLLLQAEDGNTLRVTGTDLEVLISTEQAVHVLEPGEVSVPAKVLTDLVKAMPNGSMITIGTEGRNESRVTVSTEASRYSIYGTPADEYPMKINETPLDQFTLRAYDLHLLLATVAVAMSNDDSRINLCGVHLDRSGSRLVAAATDTHRLAVNAATVAGDGYGDAIEATIPARVIKEIMRLFSGGDVVLTVSITKSQIVVTDNHTTVQGRLIEGQFPAYENVIPSDDRIVGHAKLNREMLIAAVKRANIVARAESSKVVARFNADALMLRAESSEVGLASEEVPCSFDGVDGFEIAYNAAYLLNCLESFTSVDIRLGLTGQLNPTKATTDSMPDYLHIVMPMQVL